MKKVLLKAAKVAVWALVLLLFLAAVLLLGQLLEKRIAKIHLPNAFSADNITEIIIALLSFAGGCVLEKIRANRAAREQRVNLEATAKQQSLAWEREDCLRAEAVSEERSRQAKDAYREMITGVTEYLSFHDVNYKTAAVKAVRQFLAYADSVERDAVLQLSEIISASDAFDGPDSIAVTALLDKIGVYHAQ